MKEQIHTIPVNEAFDSGDECPFCWLERQAEQRAIRFAAGNGASYMEPDVRAVTDREGFCREHLKKLYDYGNALGNALMLQTWFAGILKDLEAEMDDFVPPAKRGLLPRKKPQDAAPVSLLDWARKRQDSCYLCNKIDYSMEGYYHTFFTMSKDAEFREKVLKSKGFCLRHFAALVEQAEDRLPNSQRDWFYGEVFSLMKENLVRVKEDLDWFVGMFDYRQAGADWKNSRDAVPRTMEKLQGLHPADPPFMKEK